MTAPRRWVAALVALVLAALGLLALTTTASLAATAAPFDPPASTTQPPLGGQTHGSLSLYDSAGDPVTSGPLDAPPAYAVADNWAGVATTNKATLYAATPVEGQNPYTWPNDQISPATTFPITTGGTPTSISSNVNAAATGIFTWFDPNAAGATPGYQFSYPNNNANAAWQGYYQIRMLTSGGDVASPDDTVYASATVYLDTAAGTWTLVYPDASSGTAPTLKTAAAITGTAKVGKVLTCSAEFDGSPTPTLAYQWKRGTSDISGATGTTYKAVAADANKNVSCVVTAANTLGNVSSTSPAKKVALGDALKAITKPTLSGKPKVGKTLTCKHGTWNPPATSYKYQWLRNGKAIKGKTGAKYKIVKGDRGDRISCKVTAKKAGYKSGVATTAAKRVKG